MRVRSGLGLGRPGAGSSSPCERAQAVPPALKRGTQGDFQGSRESRGRAPSGSPAESGRGRPLPPPAGPARSKVPGRVHRGTAQSAASQRWRRRRRRHQPGTESRVRARPRSFLPCPHSRLALTSSPARAVGPEPGVRPHWAASLSVSAKKQNHHRPPDTRMEEQGLRGLVAHAETGQREGRQGGRRKAEVGPEGPRPLPRRLCACSGSRPQRGLPFWVREVALCSKVSKGRRPLGLCIPLE